MGSMKAMKRWYYGHRVIVCSEDGSVVFGTIVGESRDGECWWLHLDGRSARTTVIRHKRRCMIASKEETEDVRQAL
jgi:hypothetical protein